MIEPRGVRVLPLQNRQDRRDESREQSRASLVAHGPPRSWRKLVLACCPVVPAMPAQSPLEPTLFGHEVAAVGDRDGDGMEDLAVAAPLAWAGETRVGSVIILSRRAGALLKRIDGAEIGGEFGSSITPITYAGARAPNAIAVISRVPTAGDDKSSRWKLGVHSLTSGELIVSIPDAGRIDPVGDVDEDGCVDFLVGARQEPAGWRHLWYSGRTLCPMERPAIDFGMNVLEADLDRDGFNDCIRTPVHDAWALEVVSCRTLRRLMEVPLSGAGAMSTCRTAVCLSTRSTGGTWLLLGTEGATPSDAFLSLHATDGGSPIKTLSLEGVEVTTVTPFRAPDLDGDGVDDFLTIRDTFCHEEVCAYSSASLRQLWRAPGVVETGNPTVAFLAHSTSMTESKRECAIGRVLDGGVSGDRGTNGEVVILDAASGKEARRLKESDYPDLQFRRNRVPDSEKR